MNYFYDLPIELQQNIYREVYNNVVNEIEEVWSCSELDERSELYDIPSCDPDFAVRVNNIRVVLNRREGPCMCPNCNAVYDIYENYPAGIFNVYSD